MGVEVCTCTQRCSAHFCKEHCGAWLSTYVCPDFWVQQCILHLSQQSLVKPQTKGCLWTRVGGRFRVEVCDSQLASSSARIKHDHPPFLGCSVMGHTPLCHPSVICTCLNRHSADEGTGPVLAQSHLCESHLVSDTEVEHTLPSPGTKWRQVFPFLALALRALSPPLSNPADVSARLSSFIMGRQALSHHMASATS